jgi:two-component system, NarL family, sensor histidine kinase EvgS
MDFWGDPSTPLATWFGGAWARLSAPRAGDAAPSAQTAPDATQARILVVEDHPTFQVLTRTMLAKLGATTWLAEHGGQAYEMVCESEFDLVLMDLRMPVLDGLSATRKIRHFEHEQGRAPVPVVAYTASTYPGCESFWLDIGIDAVLEKPCSVRDLQECLLRWLPAGRVFGGVRAPGPGRAALRI